jgi:uncharacterized protein
MCGALCISGRCIIFAHDKKITSAIRMNALKVIAWAFIIVYCVIIILLYALQTKLIFYPGALGSNFKFKQQPGLAEVFLKTADGETINALFFRNKSKDVILYFHGNAGNLGGWQFVAEDFTALGYNFMIIDYRGYGKSSGRVSEWGLYQDAQAAYDFLLTKGFDHTRIIIYGRSIGSGVAMDLAAKESCQGLILEAPFISMSKLANEKLPFLFPSLYLKYRFDNINKIGKVRCPVIFLHGSDDTLIPPAHSDALFEKFKGKKKLIRVDRGSHNDLHAFRQYQEFLTGVLPSFFQ